MTAAPENQRESTLFSPLRHREFRDLWIGNFASNIGTWIQHVSQGWLVMELSTTTAWVGIVGFAALAPTALLTVFGGILADRFDRRRLLLVAQSVMMCASLLMAVLTFTRTITISLVILIVFVNGIAQAMNSPSYQAIVPALVPREQLKAAIALNSAQYHVSRILGSALSGAAMLHLGMAGSFFANGLSFTGVIVALARIRRSFDPGRKTGTVLGELSLAFRYLARAAILRDLILLVAVASFLAFPCVTFAPVLVRDMLGGDQGVLGLLLACSGGGAVLGAVSTSVFKSIRCSGALVVVGATAMFTSVSVFALSRSVLLSCVAQVIAGYSMVLIMTIISSLLQHSAEDSMRGRVMSIYGTAFIGFLPLGNLLASLLSTVCGVPMALATMNACGVLLCIGVFAFSPSLRRLDESACIAAEGKCG